MNPYTTTFTGTTPHDGPTTFHLILLDNGRTTALHDTTGRQALRCIRCSACLNVCPVYERAGGHAYGSPYPGPIGAILTPQLRGTTNPIDTTLPYASTLCGACYDVCPVAINIPDILIHLRERITDQRRGHTVERTVMKAAGWVLDHPAAFAFAERGASRTRRLHPAKLPLPGPAKAWSNDRDLPQIPGRPFRDWWKTRPAGDTPQGQPAREDTPR